MLTTTSFLFVLKATSASKTIFNTENVIRKESSYILQALGVGTSIKNNHGQGCYLFYSHFFILNRKNEAARLHLLNLPRNHPEIVHYLQFTAVAYSLTIIKQSHGIRLVVNHFTYDWANPTTPKFNVLFR